MQALTGQVLDHYCVETQLGAGGMGIVYKAYDVRLERPVAIKLLARPSDDAAREILCEARTASALNHPHICTIYEVGETAGQAYIVMEYIEGQTLRDAIPADGLAVESAVMYAIQIADAISHAHDHGVIHRDLKSGNIVITPEGRSKILDFGLASRFTPAHFNEISKLATREDTNSDTAAGTLAYMAPEVLRGKPPDARSDIWALGVVLYEMLTSRLPFYGRNNVELCTEILREPPWPLRASLDPGLRGIVLRCLMKEPRQRYQRASEVRAALETIQRELETSASPTERLHSVPLTLPWRVTGKASATAAAVFGSIVLVSLAVPQTRGMILPSSWAVHVAPAEPAASSSPTTNTEAYNLYLKGTNALREKPDREGANAAIQFYDEAVRQDAGFALAYAAKSEALLQLYREKREREWAEQAQYVAERARQLDASRPETHLAVGTVYNVINKRQEAIAALKRTLALSPNSDKAYRELGKAYAATGHGQDAMQALQKAVEINPFDPEHYNVLGTVASSLGRYPEAAEAFRRVAEIEPDRARGYGNLGAMHLKMGQFNEAADAFQNALKLEQLPALYGNLGLTYANTGRFAEAVQMLQKAIDLGPTEERLVNLADGYRWLGQPAKADPIYAKAISVAFQKLKLEPRDTRTLAALALSYAKRGKDPLAMQYIAMARRIKADDVDLIFAEATIQLLAGRRPQALASLRDAFRAGFSPAAARQDPDFRVLREDPSFQALMKEFGGEPR